MLAALWLSLIHSLFFAPDQTFPSPGPGASGHAGGGAAISLLAHTGTNVIPTGPIDTTGANLIVVVVGNYGVTGTVTDSKSNLWTLGYTVQDGGGNYLRFYFMYAPTAGTGHTFSFTGTYCSVVALAYSGAAGSAMDQSSQSLSHSNTVQPGPITPTANGEVLITACSGDGLLWPSASISGSGFSTVIENVAYAGGNGEPVVVSNSVQTTAAAANPTWNLGNPGQLCGIVSFK